MSDPEEGTLVFLQETLKWEIDSLQKLYDDAEKSKSFGRKVDLKKVEQDEINYLNKLQANLKEQPYMPLTDYLDLEHVLELELKKQERLEQLLIAENKRLEQEVEELKAKNEKIEEMKAALLDRGLSSNKKNYKEIRAKVNKKFIETKEGLAHFAGLIFPDNGDFDDLLSDLTKACMKGGDDVYIEVLPEHAKLIRFLLECDLIAFHPHDKKLIKFQDLL